MITYGYTCYNKKCELIFECAQSIKDEPLKECPACQQRTLQRDIGGGIAIIIKTATPTTLGSLAEKNTERLLKERGRLPYNTKNPDPKFTPIWRKNQSGSTRPINFKVLQNPKRYIEHGI